MERLLRFSARHALGFTVLAIIAWIVVSGVAAFVTAAVLGMGVGEALPQSLGTLVASAAVLLVMQRWGWLRPAGVTVLGSARLWLATVVLAAALVLVYRLVFFGEFGLDPAVFWGGQEARGILLRQMVVGFVEELLFRGLLLYALVRAWGATRRGLLAAVAVQAALFGVLHLLQFLAGNDLDDTLLTVLNAFVGGVWAAALVLLGGSLWPAVLIHAVGNASVQLGAAALGAGNPPASAFVIATAAELPLVALGLWLLRRRTPAHPPGGASGPP